MKEHQITALLKRVLDKATEETVTDGRVDPRRVFFVRPSAFPYCGLRTLLSFQDRLHEVPAVDFGGSYFTGVGTTVHSVIQNYMGFSPHVIGDWKCRRCGTVRRFSERKPCSKCKGHDLQYEELEIVYKNTALGHIDGLIRLEPKLGKNSPHVVIDYKTSSTFKIDKANKYPGTLPLRENVFQIRAYVPLIEQLYQVPVVGWSLIYISRDRPFSSGRHVVSRLMDEPERAKVLRRVDHIVRVHRKVLKAKTLEDFAIVRKHKICKDAEHYKADYMLDNNKCPFAPICFNDKKLDQKLESLHKQHRKVWPLISQASIDIQSELGMLPK